MAENNISELEQKAAFLKDQLLQVQEQIESAKEGVSDKPKRKRNQKRYYCQHEGCTKYAQNRGHCWSHGSTYVRKTCNHDGCPNKVSRGGFCVTHGDYVAKTCSEEGCTNKAQTGGVVCNKHARISKHGSGREQCSVEGCTYGVKKGGVCGTQ